MFHKPSFNFKVPKGKSKKITTLDKVRVLDCSLACTIYLYEPVQIFQYTVNTAVKISFVCIMFRVLNKSITLHTVSSLNLVFNFTNLFLLSPIYFTKIPPCVYTPFIIQIKFLFRNMAG